LAYYDSAGRSRSSSILNRAWRTQRNYVDSKVDSRMRQQMNVGNTLCSSAPWVCSRERAEAIWKSEYPLPDTPNPYRN
jgi:hypothetical protein